MGAMWELCWSGVGAAGHCVEAACSGTGSARGSVGAACSFAACAGAVQELPGGRIGRCHCELHMHSDVAA